MLFLIIDKLFGLIDESLKKDACSNDLDKLILDDKIENFGLLRLVIIP